MGTAKRQSATALRGKASVTRRHGPERRARAMQGAPHPLTSETAPPRQNVMSAPCNHARHAWNKHEPRETSTTRESEPCRIQKYNETRSLARLPCRPAWLKIHNPAGRISKFGLRQPRQKHQHVKCDLKPTVWRHLCNLCCCRCSRTESETMPTHKQFGDDRTHR